MPKALVHVSEHPIQLPIFEGPLDLLLFLIRKHELNIYDIPLETVTQQYLAILASMEQLDIEIAGEFFVTAATLMYIKSRLLIAKQDSEAEQQEGDNDPRWELLQQLIAYQKVKQTADKLAQRIDACQDLMPRQMGYCDVKTEPALLSSDKMHLWTTFNQVLRRFIQRASVQTLQDDPITVADCMETILKRLQSEPHFKFSHLLSGSPSLTAVIAYFFAILELSRLSKLILYQEAPFSDIGITR